MNWIATFVTVSLAFLALASSHDSTTSRRSRHVRGSLDSPTTNITARDETKTLQRRFGPNARFSWYHPGLGACGKTNGPNDFIVALTQTQFGNGEHCFEQITITYKGKTAQATIVDECMECPYGALDFSPGLFNYFGSTADGYLYGSWEFGSGQDFKPETTSTPPPPPKPTTTKKVMPTSTWTPEPTTSSTASEKASTPTSTTSTHASATSSPAISKTASSSGTLSTSTNTTSMSVNPSTTAVAVPTDNFGQLNLVMADLGAILVGGVLVGAGGQ